MKLKVRHSIYETKHRRDYPTEGAFYRALAQMSDAVAKTLGISEEKVVVTHYDGGSYRIEGAHEEIVEVPL